MNILEAIFLGLVQGLTEWFPVSSSGHLALAQKAMGETSPSMVGYDVVLHIATVLVVFVFYWKGIKEIVKDWLKGLMEAMGADEKIKALMRKKERRMGWLIIIASVPTALIGFALNKYVITDAFSSLPFLAAGFLATGVFLALTRFAPSTKKELGAKEAAAIGTVQGIAVLPALSRSGWTVGSSLLLGLDKEDAGKFSFLMLIPAVLGAALLKFGDIKSLAASELPVMLVGAAVAAAVGYACLALMLKVIRRQKVWWFAPYCLALGVGIFIWVAIYGA